MLILPCGVGDIGRCGSMLTPLPLPTTQGTAQSCPLVGPNHG